MRAPHGGIEAAAHASVFQIEQHLVAVLRGEPLHHLDAAPVTVHVAEAAGIHQNVEAELLPGAEAAQHFVVLAAMPQAQVDDLAPESLARNLQRLPDLPIRVVTVLVQQSGCDLHFKRLLVEQINNRLRGRHRLALH